MGREESKQHWDEDYIIICFGILCSADTLAGKTGFKNRLKGILQHSGGKTMFWRK